MENLSSVASSSVASVGWILGLGCLGIAIALGMIGSNAAVSIGRNPEVKNDILQSALILGFMAFVILIVIVAFSIILLFANPYIV